MITWVDCTPIDTTLNPGDTVSIVIGDEIIVRHEVTETMKVNVAKLGIFMDEFDMKSGYIGIIGEKK